MPATETLTFSPLIVGTMRLGAWGAKFTSTELESFLDGCLNLGLRDFDHADIYGSYTEEAAFGKVLARRPGMRQRMQITTKCGIKMISENRPAHKIKSYDSSRVHILASVENSLRDLRTDYLDLLLIHRPDFLMDANEIAEAFAKLKTAGKVRHFGVSNFTPSQLELLHQATPMANHQVEISLTHLDPFTDGTLDQCQRLGIRPTAWSPLGGGAIFESNVGRVSNPTDVQAQRIRVVGNAIAERHSASLDQVLLAWLRKHPSGIIPVLGTSKFERVEAAFESFKIELSREEWYELWQASVGAEVA